MSDFCETCGAHIYPTRPRVEVERSPSTREWHIWLERVEQSGATWGARIRVSDRGEWSVDGPRELNQ